MAMSTKAATTIFVVVLTSLPVLPACGGGAQAQSNTDTQAGAVRTTGPPASAQERGIVARAGDGTVARASSDETRTNDREKATGTDAEGGNHSQGITLKIGSDPGTKFSGRCSVGSEEKIFGGRVPARYVYEPGGGKLECEMRKGGAGTLEVVLAAGNNVRSVQRTSAQSSTINFAYSSSRISSSTFGSSG
jgi:hypothetical protein